MAFIVVVLIFAMVGVVIASQWVLYEKAGKPGWAVLLPFYNILVMLEIIGKPWWWLLLMIIPYIGGIWAIWSFNLFIKSFGKTEGYTIGCLFLPFIFLPMLAFGNDTEFMGQPQQFNY